MQFQRATRRRSFIKIALTGASGAGKTYSALKLAQGLGERIALVDTENGSGSLYADIAEYDTLELRAPFTTERYQEAIQMAVEAGFDVLILDSLSHAWAGEGGLLAQKEAADVRGGNQFTNWAPITRKHEAFKQAILQAPLHVIATMRSKVEYVVEQQGDRRSTPRKVGMAPIQRDGMEYEFTLVFDIQADHSAIPSKDRTSLFAGFHAPITPADGQMIAKWLDSGAEPAPQPVFTSAAAPTAPPAENGAAQPAAKPEAPVMVCSWHPCATPLTKAQYEISLRTYGQPLCPKCQKKAASGETPTAPPAPVEDDLRAQQQAEWKELIARARAAHVDIEECRPKAGMAAEGIAALLRVATGIVEEAEAGKQEVAA